MGILNQVKFFRLVELQNQILLKGRSIEQNSPCQLVINA
jgi:hypothetical protein